MIKKLKGSDRQAVLSILHRPLEENAAAAQSVQQIIQRVQQEGDAAVFAYTREFDGVVLDSSTICVTDEEFQWAETLVDPEWRQMIRRSADRIRTYHEKQKRQSWMDVDKGAMLGQLIQPIESAGIYVPGGRASYPSSVLMNAIPAQVAGVSNIVMVTPPNSDGSLPAHTLLAAREAGVHRIFKVGGAQAIAALTYGTQSIPKVEKITGPGNMYVALAKKMVFGQVGIDSIAGPSEVLILADETANPAYIAADMLAQAEHDPQAAAVLITDSQQIIERVEQELTKQLNDLPRKEIAEASLSTYGALVLVEDMMAEGFDLANEMAPEHLELLLREPLAALGYVKNAGAVFLGAYAPEAIGDYMAGPNHVLPTNGTARFFSPLSVDDFVKKSSVLYFDRTAMRELCDDVVRFANSEGLDAHARSAAIRFIDG